MFKMLMTSLAMAAFASLALAQDYPAAASSTQNALPTSGAAPASATGTNHNVTVGGTDGTVIKFTPDNLANVAVGDTITFNFEAKNHTVTQSTFASPCVAKDNGFNTGFNPVPIGTVDGKAAVFNVTTTNPLWFYCQQTNHCQKGMVFAVNPTTNQTVAQFQANAKNASSSSTTPSGSSGDSSGTATGTDAAASSTDTGTAANSNAITTAVVDNVGFITVLAIVGGFILAL